VSRYRRPNREFQQICDLARRRVVAVLQCVDVLLPGIDARRKKRLANRILTLCDGKDRTRKISPAAVEEIFFEQMQCIYHKCPMLLFSKQLAEQVNAYFEEE
jgi:hypothetical protein